MYVYCQHNSVYFTQICFSLIIWGNDDTTYKTAPKQVKMNLLIAHRIRLNFHGLMFDTRTRECARKSLLRARRAQTYTNCRRPWAIRKLNETNEIYRPKVTSVSTHHEISVYIKYLYWRRHFLGVTPQNVTFHKTAVLIFNAVSTALRLNTISSLYLLTWSVTIMTKS
jgi:hypothetical protein